MRNMMKVAGGLLALALLVSVAPVQAASRLEGDAKAHRGLGEFFGGANDAAQRLAAKLPGVPSRGVYGKDHCSPYDDSMVPVNGGNGDSEMGYYCVSKTPASVSCPIIGWQEVFESESGIVHRPIYGTPCTCSWGDCNGGRDGDRGNEPQAP